MLGKTEKGSWTQQSYTMANYASHKMTCMLSFHNGAALQMMSTCEPFTHTSSLLVVLQVNV